MGCGASAAPYNPQTADAEPDPAPSSAVVIEKKPEEPKPVTVAVEGGGDLLLAEDVDPQDGGEDGPEDGGIKLPFVRFDKSKVPKELMNGDDVYLKLEPTGAFLVPDPGVNKLDCTAAEPSGDSIYVISRKDGDGKLMDGDTVTVKHVATGQFLQAETDAGPVTLAERNPDLASQLFSIYKLGHPLQLRHGDTVFLQSWLQNYVELRTTETGEQFVGAKRWRRGANTHFQILKKRVLDQPKTDTARKMQFQSFDLDGNGSISRAEMEYMLKMVGGDVGALDEIMAIGEADGIGYDAFATWADGGFLTEAQLSHAEAIGNIAQRCSDALNEEQALIEVLAVPSLKSVMEMKALYSGTFPDAEGNPGNLIAEINNKTGEQDGWIFTNWWKRVMECGMEDEVDIWCRCLKDSMDGWGTDEDALTFLICTLPERLRPQIFKRFHEMCGKGLLERIEDETSGKYKKVLVCQAMAPEDCKAKLIYDSIKGLGTDEDQLVRIICQMDIPERQQVKEAFQRMYNADMVQWIIGDTSGNFQKALVLMCTAKEKPFDLEADCEAIYKAMDGWGTDEAALVELICGKTKRQMEMLNEKFNELYSQRKNLFDFVKSETSGHFQAVMLGCIRHPMEQLAECVYRTMKGWGTCELGLITMLVHLPDFKKEALKKEYKKQYKRDLLKHIKSETSGDLQECLMNLVRPAPTVWAMVLRRAMKGLGTDEKSLINTMCIGKDDMGEVRKAFKVLCEQKNTLVGWLKGDTSGDFKKCLAGLANRDTENEATMSPIYWAQRARDAVRNADTLKSVLVTLPSPAIKRGTEIYKIVYKNTLEDEIKKKTEEGSGWFTWTNYYKKGLLNLLKSPVDLYIDALEGAMRGFGTDEFTLTGLVCTIPENQSDAILQGFEQKYKRSLYDRIKGETSSSYQKALLFQVSTFAESRARALYEALSGWWTDQDQVIRVLLITSQIERRNINQAYKDLFKKSISAHIEEAITDEPFLICLQAMLEETEPMPDEEIDWEGDCESLNQALEGEDVDTDAIIRAVSKKQPEQMERLQKQFEDMFGKNLRREMEQKLEDNSWSGMFSENHFRNLVLGLLRSPIERLAYAVRDCIKGWGTAETGLLTCLVHLSERKKKDLIDKYMEVPFGGDIFAAIKGDCSGTFEHVLISLLEPAPRVMAKALRTSMKGIGTSDDLLINWMCIAKDRMDEVREEFKALNSDGKDLAQWIDGDCGNADYKDLLMRLANRYVYKFVGSDVAMTIPPPMSQDMAIYQFAKVFNEFCRIKKQNPGRQLQISDEAQQEMGTVFMFYGKSSSCCPNLDKRGVWDLTNAVGFPPADDGPDLVATFNEWDVSGTGEITWNDFVREMTTRINDPNHYEADPLPEIPPPGMESL